MNLAGKFFAPVLPVLIIIGMYTGLYNPRVEPFAPPAAVKPAVVETMPITGDYAIVVGADASPAERTAAQKLQYFLNETGGLELAIVEDTAPEQAREIVVGGTTRYALNDAALGEEGFIIKTQGEKIVIAGGQARGALYGVYDFLEEFVGCRFFTKDMKIVPRHDAITVPKEIDVREIPAFDYRSSTTVMGIDDVDSALANRVNSGWSLPPELSTAAYGGLNGLNINHEVQNVLGVAGQLEAHPEIFAKGGDGVTPYGGYTNPCLTGPVDLFAAYAASRIDAGAVCVSLGLNDSGDTCQCEACKAVYAEELTGANVNDGFSGAYVRWLNRVCEALEAKGGKYAQAKISGFGYGITEAPPVTPCHDNIVIYFCPVGMCYAHTLEGCTQEQTHYTFDVNFQGWKAKCGNIAIFEYPLTYDHYGIPYPIWGAMQSYLQYYRDNGVIGLINCSNAADDAGLYAMTGWLYARLLWNPDADMDALYEKFLPGYYGPGWQYVREYIRITAEELTGRTLGGVQYHTQCQKGSTPIGNLCMTNNQIKYIDALWARAKEQASGAQLMNIRRAEISFRIWKADNFRSEFWPLNFPPSRTVSGKRLFEDILECDVTMHDQSTYYFGSPRDVWPAGHPKAGQQKFDKQLFYDLKLYILWPRYWSSRQFGGDADMEGINGLGDMLLSLFS